MPRTEVEVGGAAGGIAAALPRPRDGDDGQVVPVDEAHVIEVLVGGAALPQRDLEERRWRLPARAAALHVSTTAVAGLARDRTGGRARAVGAEVAPRARPYPAGPTGRRRDPHGLPRVEPEPRRGQLRRARAGHRPRPDGVGAVVGYGEAAARR